MADVFISYAREDKVRAEQVAHGLEAAGVDVFWDSEIPPGQTWADYIESKLSQCKAVIVLWSENSTRSQWVREEARMGRDKGKLIPAALDDSPAPFGFGEVQAANLKGWGGEAGHPEWERLLAAVVAAVRGAGARPEPPPRRVQAAAAIPSSSQAAAKKPWWRSGWAMAGGGAIAAIVVLGIIGANIDDGASPNGGDKPASEVAAPVSTPPIDAPAQPQQAQDYMGQLQGQLAQAAQQYGQQGYQPVGQPYTSGLAVGGVQTLPVITLEQGMDYQIHAVCDNDCRDIDMRVTDENNNEVGSDVSSSDRPTVQVVPRWTGTFNVHITMAQCAVAPCYFATQLYGRPAPQ